MATSLVERKIERGSGMGSGEREINKLCRPGGCLQTLAKKASSLLADFFEITRRPMESRNDFKADCWCTTLIKRILI